MARSRSRRSGVAFAAGLVVLAACGGDKGDGATVATAVPPTTPSTAPTTAATTAATTAPTSTTRSRATSAETTAATTATTAIATTAAAPVSGNPPRLRAVRVGQFTAPIALAVRAGDDAVYVAEKGGVVKALRSGATDPTPVLDLSGQVSTGSEQGLLGLVFSPDGSRLFVDYTDTAGDSRVVEYAFSAGRADTSTRRELLLVQQPFSNHNGGHVVFGPDGFLYIGLGDGGSAGDPQGNGQRLDTLLGKILRIDPRPDGNAPYSIPPGNPFASRQGARPEIWAYGLRNPWRFTFDRETGALWIGDVGQAAIEEIDAVEASAGGGQNYGWNRLEGTRRFAGSAPPGSVAPVHEYSHEGGNCSVTGGYVYRGTRIPALRGSYVFADYCKGELRALVLGGSGLRSVVLGPTLDAVSSFGQDADGELFVLSLVAGLHRLEAAS